MPGTGVASQGDTIDEARKNLHEALELFFETASPEEIKTIKIKGDVGSKTTYDSRNRFNIVQYKMFLFA